MPTPSFDVSFLKNVNIREHVDIDKSIDVRAFVFGNSAMANSTADAYGSNSHTETLALTTTAVVEGVGSSSSSIAESVSLATPDPNWSFHW